MCLKRSLYSAKIHISQLLFSWNYEKVELKQRHSPPCSSVEVLVKMVMSDTHTLFFESDECVRSSDLLCLTTCQIHVGRLISCIIFLLFKLQWKIKTGVVTIKEKRPRIWETPKERWMVGFGGWKRRYHYNF